MRTAALYGRTQDLAQTTKGLLLLFDNVQLLIDQRLAERVADDSPEVLGYLLDRGLVSILDASSVFVEEEVYQKQRELLRWCLDNLELEVDERDYSSYKRTPRTKQAFHGYFANDFVDEALVDELVRRGWALPVDTKLPATFYRHRYPQIPDIVLSPVPSASPFKESSESDADVMVPTTRP